MPRAFRDDEAARIRDRLLAEGRAALARTGFRQTSVAALAAAAGIAKGSFYRFFPTKEDLWIAVLEGEERRARAAVEAAEATPAPGRLRAVVAAVVGAAAGSPVLAALADPADRAWLERSLPVDRLAAAQQDDARYFAAVRERLLADGLLDPAVAAEAFADLGSLGLGLAGQRGPLGEARLTALLDLVCDGLAARLAPGAGHGPWSVGSSR